MLQSLTADCTVVPRGARLQVVKLTPSVPQLPISVAKQAAPRLICHFAEGAIDSPFFRAIARLHDREMFPVQMITLHAPGPLHMSLAGSGVQAFGLGVSRKHYPLAVLNLARQLRRGNVQLLHAHSFDATLVGIIAARIANIPFVFTRHHSDHHLRINKRWHVRIDSLCARHADRVIAVSEETRRIMVEQEGVPKKRIAVVYNGVDATPAPSAETRARLRGELSLPNVPIILMIARLHEEKGHRYLLEAIPDVIRSFGPVILLLAGEGPERRSLESQVQANGLGEVVRFLGWRRDVAALIDSCSLLVLPSLAESFGQVLTEAMSLGKPVVAAKTGGIPEVVADGETGILVPPRNPSTLAAAISRILMNPVWACAMGNAGRRRVDRFSYDSMVRGYESVYTEIFPRPS